MLRQNFSYIVCFTVKKGEGSVNVQCITQDKLICVLYRNMLSIFFFFLYLFVCLFCFCIFFTKGIPLEGRQNFTVSNAFFFFRISRLFKGKLIKFRSAGRFAQCEKVLN